MGLAPSSEMALGSKALEIMRLDWALSKQAENLFVSKPALWFHIVGVAQLVRQ